jgi:excisionase family DNA binding protein
MDDLLSVSDAARVLDVTPSTVRMMERLGKLPALRTAGGMRLFQREHVEQLAAERRAGEPAETVVNHAPREDE